MSKDRLLVDDNGAALLTLTRALKAAGINQLIHGAGNAGQALSLFMARQPAVVILDLCLDQTGVESGYALLKEFLDRDPSCRVIVLTGHGSDSYGLRALKLGAAHFLPKPADLPHLQVLIKDSCFQAQLRRELLRVNGSNHSSVFDALKGKSTVMQSVREQALLAASSDQSILLTGETGTGKELLARCIHRASLRGFEKFLRYQASCTSAELVNAELFGELSSSRIGSGRDQSGLLQAVEGGSLFLHNVADLPSATQLALSGVLQERALRRLGSSNSESINFRLIAASNHSIDQALQSGQLRFDFYHRLAHSSIHLPALRERSEDIEILAEHFLARLFQLEKVKQMELSAAALIALQKYSWPGNVRELENVLETAAYSAQQKGRREILMLDLRLGREQAVNSQSSILVTQPLEEQVKHFKMKLVEQALVGHDYNQVKAAAALGIDRSTLRRIRASFEG